MYFKSYEISGYGVSKTNGTTFIVYIDHFRKIDPLKTIVRVCRGLGIEEVDREKTRKELREDFSGDCKSIVNKGNNKA